MEMMSTSEATQLHAQLVKAGNGDNLFTSSALSPSPRSSNLSYARTTHPNSYLWNTVIRAYSRTTQSIHLFLSMQRLTHPKPDRFTYPFLLKSCAVARNPHQGKQFHALIFKNALHSDPFIQNSLIHMYSQCGDPDAATRVFDKMPNRDVVSWTSIIDGYVDHNRSSDALSLFRKMEEEGVQPNDATLVSLLRACADLGALGTGTKLHEIVRHTKIDNPNVVTALIHMYSKCGCLESARRLFQDMGNNKDVFAWTTMISGLAAHAETKNALCLFEQMVQLRVKPDVRTITAVLSACRNAGWVREGYCYFSNMEKRFGIRPTIQHYGCMVDLLARVGHLEEAEQFIKRMPIEPDLVVWRNLIWACHFHGDKDRTLRLMNQHRLFGMDSCDSGTYVLFGNVYASTGKWSEKAKVRELANGKGLVKLKGSTKIELNGTIQEFVAGDTGHPDAEKIYQKLDQIGEALKLAGYQPKLSEVRLDIEDEEKAFQLSHHSEKLAVAFALISTNRDTKIQMVKNLRSCEDCHSVMKNISKMYQREIVMRDRIRFHHFKNGSCSCGDYW